MSDKKYREIGMHYANCLRQHGDSHFGVDWPTQEGAIRRYDVMIEFITQRKVADRVKVLDFGCGLSGLWDRIVELGFDDAVEYTGIDINQEYVDLSRQKFPNNDYLCVDILAEDVADIGQYDYVLLNGLFTQKMSLGNEEMLRFLEGVLVKVFAHTRVGLQFNCMSPLVDYKKDGAFHFDFDSLSRFLVAKLSRSFVIRHDIFPYEYFCGVYK
jgi:SAM-dependent methyltransferase